MVVTFIFFLGIMILNQNLPFILKDKAYLHASHHSFDNGQLQSGLYGKWTV